MAADGGGGALKRLFEKPLPENPTLLEALSAWNHTHRNNKLIDPASFTEIFGELHFQEKISALPSPSPSLPPPPPPRRTVSWLDVATAAADAENDKSKDDSSLDALLKPPKPSPANGGVKRSASFCLKSSASLLLYTEGLGSESTVDADDMVKDADVEEASVVVVDKVNEMMDVDTCGGDAVDVADDTKEERRRAAAAAEDTVDRARGEAVRVLPVGAGGGEVRVAGGGDPREGSAAGDD